MKLFFLDRLIFENNGTALRRSVVLLDVWVESRF